MEEHGRAVQDVVSKWPAETIAGAEMDWKWK